MKQNFRRKRLALNKQTGANQNNFELSNVRGGDSYMSQKVIDDGEDCIKKTSKAKINCIPKIPTVTTQKDLNV